MFNVSIKVKTCMISRLGRSLLQDDIYIELSKLSQLKLMEVIMI